MFYYTYVISSKQRNYIYVGITNNLERRLKEHNFGNNKTTKPYKPFRLLLHEKHITRVDARKREKYFKGGSGKEFLKSLL